MNRKKTRAESQRRRIIYLLEEIADVDHKEQCKWCGEWFDHLPAHEQHCNN